MKFASVGCKEKNFNLKVCITSIRSIKVLKFFYVIFIPSEKLHAMSHVFVTTLLLIFYYNTKMSHHTTEKRRKNVNSIFLCAHIYLGNFFSIFFFFF